MNKFLIILSGILFSCTIQKIKTQPVEKNYTTIGSIERFDPALDNIISKDAKAEIIAEGFDWSEGPLWIEKHKMLFDMSC